MINTSQIFHDISKMSNRNLNLKHPKCHGLLISYEQMVIKPFIASILIHKCNFQENSSRRTITFKGNKLKFFHLVIQLQSFLVRTKYFEALADFYKKFHAKFPTKLLNLCTNQSNNRYDSVKTIAVEKSPLVH